MKIKKKWVVAFLVPSTLLFLFVYALSLVVLLVTSFTQWNIGQEIKFIGIQNYVELFTSTVFKAAALNTVKWVLLQSSVHVLIGVMFALVVSRRAKSWHARFARTVFMIPNIISSAAWGMVFLCILNPKFGLLNSIVRLLSQEEYSQNWFMDPKTAFLSVTMIWLPFAATVALIVSAEMTAVDSTVYEAASIDGATYFQTSVYITLPLMKNAIATGTILSATSMLQKLDIILMTTNGGPGTTTINMPLLIYETSMRENNYSLASAQGIILIMMGLVSIGIINRIYRMNKED
ncbi:carbohydrate ABC transporter permease [Ohessyouella blattaphilus]|uniref:Sugar ABC transporter permease n=1 Tax=Ohessyouella blattaphilus TaxID=2949333 RepID=A0ABT1EKQ3_9FIRM|nr:sugar ABC transporter permease [Ohessyouella blattaphilus]MCP1111280.1 sugar ABC transporter permease [Ohessyouella blattaphilus]MCR8564674.1 sugar ABC transporter permease [Ohessyouella blattaphilus]MDL2249721.1 sugar ABC transporter permease [Lachnospiraceae bacterium OttesenSCG-928-J05]